MNSRRFSINGKRDNPSAEAREQNTRPAGLPLLASPERHLSKLDNVPLEAHPRERGSPVARR